MTMQITEGIVAVGDTPTLRTIVPPERVTNEEIVRRCKIAKMRSGEVVRVICVSSRDDENSFVVAEAEYRVTSRTTGPTMIEKPDGSMHQDVAIIIEVELWIPWRIPERIATSVPVSKITSTWNFGKKGYVMEQGGQVIGFEKDKAVAEQMVAASEAV